MNLNLFENERKENGFINKFIKELKNALGNISNKNQNNSKLDDYNIYEKKKVFLDNKSRRSNELAWVMDNNSVCISEEGDGGPISINEIELPSNAKIGEVYEKINGKYVYNSEISKAINEIE